MPRDLISDVTLAAMSKVLDATAARHRAIAHNIANVDAPGFVRRDVSFHDPLATALSDGDEHPLLAPERASDVDHSSRSSLPETRSL